MSALSELTDSINKYHQNVVKVNYPSSVIQHFITETSFVYGPEAKAFLIHSPLLTGINNFVYPATGKLDPFIFNSSMASDPEMYAMFLYDSNVDSVLVNNILGLKVGWHPAKSIIAALEIASALKASVPNSILSGSSSPPFPVSPSTPPAGYILPRGQTIKDDLNLTAKIKENKKSICDCGAASVGYEDTDDFAHSSWCAVNKKR